jgi:hypothetical protein
MVQKNNIFIDKEVNMEDFLISLPKINKKNIKCKRRGKYKETILKSESVCLTLPENVKVFLDDIQKCEKCGKTIFIISHPFNTEKPYAKNLFLFCPYCFFKKKISFNTYLKLLEIWRR